MMSFLRACQDRGGITVAERILCDYRVCRFFTRDVRLDDSNDSDEILVSVKTWRIFLIRIAAWKSVSIYKSAVQLGASAVS